MLSIVMLRDGPAFNKASVQVSNVGDKIIVLRRISVEYTNFVTGAYLGINYYRPKDPEWPISVDFLEPEPIGAAQRFRIPGTVLRNIFIKVTIDYYEVDKQGIGTLLMPGSVP